MAPPDQDVTEAAVRTWCGDYLAKALRIQRNRIEERCELCRFRS